METSGVTAKDAARNILRVRFAWGVREPVRIVFRPIPVQKLRERTDAAACRAHRSRDRCYRFNCVRTVPFRIVIWVTLSQIQIAQSTNGSEFFRTGSML
jgi:hypothetical protein